MSSLSDHNIMFYEKYLLLSAQRKRWEITHLTKLQPKLDFLSNIRAHYDINAAYTVARELYDYRNYYLGEHKILSKDEFAAECSALEKSYEFKINSLESNVFTFETRGKISEADPETNSLYEVDLGKFKVSITFTNSISSAPSQPELYSAKCTPIGENKPRSISGGTCYHPHVSSSQTLCLGDYGNKGFIYEDCKRLNIIGMFYNLCALVNRYNANSLNYSGAYITNWVGHKCAVCYEFAPEAVQCAKTKAFIHVDCAEKIGEDYYSLGVFKKCTECGNKTHSYIAYSTTKFVCSECEVKNNVKS